jgi:short-subunit dehydrogenase
MATVELDINRDDAVDREMPRLIERFGGIDVLVNNAGYSLWGPGQRVSVDQLRAQFETNFFGPFKLIKHVLPGMVDRGSGKIINISSVEGRLATPFSGAYAASKFALEGLSEAMRVELWPLGVHVCLVEPGLFRTNFGNNTVFGEEIDDQDKVYGPYVERYRSRRARYDRLTGDPVKVAKVVHRIIRSRRPAFRYPVGIEARLGILGARLVPERLFQSLLSRSTIR